jgi:hypothetical protein
MIGFFGNILDGAIWFLATGWKVWSSLFAPLPYGDPYLAIASAMVIIVIALKILNPALPNR